MQIDFKQFPTTRYQGSKRKLLPWLYKHFSSLQFSTALDVFGGTASVSYLFKTMGKTVTYNDYLRCNYYIGKALIENDNVFLTTKDVEFLLRKHKTIKYIPFVEDTFKGIYYTDKENAWIDRFLCNWENISNIYPENISEYKKAMAFYAFCQSALKKRPFNLFHRANLYLRLNEVKRKFGNKTSWEGSFETYFKSFATELNGLIFSNKKKHYTLNNRASEINTIKAYDLVYIDPPYIRKEASGSDVDYLKFYHFLEGACDKQKWKTRINYSSKNLSLNDSKSNEWTSPKFNKIAFEDLFKAFKKSTIVISYKEPGIPSKSKMIKILKKFKRRVISIPGKEYSYALNKNNGFHKEYLLIGLDNN
ncbi:MAG: DNA adenine methylase [Candidatus Omnitrophica bacterium]|nr:DNA adenine methylase [Candidatus Omnitrophota bacterium]